MTGDFGLLMTKASTHSVHRFDNNILVFPVLVLGYDSMRFEEIVCEGTGGVLSFGGDVRILVSQRRRSCIAGRKSVCPFPPFPRYIECIVSP